MDAKLSKALRAIDAQRQDFESPPDTLVNVPDGAGGVAQVPSMWVANNAEDVVLEVTSPNWERLRIQIRTPAGDWLVIADPTVGVILSEITSES